MKFLAHNWSRSANTFLLITVGILVMENRFNAPVLCQTTLLCLSDFWTTSHKQEGVGQFSQQWRLWVQQMSIGPNVLWSGGSNARRTIIFKAAYSTVVGKDVYFSVSAAVLLHNIKCCSVSGGSLFFFPLNLEACRHAMMLCTNSALVSLHTNWSENLFAKTTGFFSLSIIKQNGFYPRSLMDRQHDSTRLW